MSKESHRSVLQITVAALFMAITIALSSYGIPVPGGHLYLCDVAICLAAVLLDPPAAFLVGGLGSFLGDLIFYPLPLIDEDLAEICTYMQKLSDRFTDKDPVLAMASDAKNLVVFLCYLDLPEINEFLQRDKYYSQFIEE